MKRRATIILSLALLTGIVHADVTEQQAGRIASTVGSRLGKYHYRQVELNNEISKIHLENYLNALDFGHMIFLQRDVDEFRKTYGTRLDDEIKFGKIRPAQIIFNKYIERLTQCQKLVDELLKKNMDYTKNERHHPSQK